MAASASTAEQAVGPHDLVPSIAREEH